MLKIYGCSDDLVELEGHVEDEVDCDGAVIVVGWPEAEQGRDAQGVRIAMKYGAGDAGPVWVASVSQIDEDVLIPWPVTIGNMMRDGSKTESYSVFVAIDCPGDVPVRVTREPGNGSMVWRPGMNWRHLDRSGDVED